MKGKDLDVIGLAIHQTHESTTTTMIALVAGPALSWLMFRPTARVGIDSDIR